MLCFSAKLGGSTVVIEAPEGLACDLGRAILSACEQPAPVRIIGKLGQPKRPNPLHAKFALIAAELQRDNSRGRLVKLCEEHGVSYMTFKSWERRLAAANAGGPA